jgi:hypothetical protein
MKIVISIFLLPHEISILDNLLYSLNKASNHLSGDFHYFLDIGMSLSDEIINWDDSHLPKAFFTTWFKNLQKRTSWPDEIDFHFTKARGSLEYKRIKQKEYGSFDYVILIDSDIIFDEKILFHFENTYKNLKNTNQYQVITPEIVPWGNSKWEQIWNKKYEKIKSETYHETLNPFVETFNENPIEVVAIDTFVFGAGWFTSMNVDLFIKAKLPDTFFPYGPDDVFWFDTFKRLSDKGVDIKQYKIKNLIVSELHSHRFLGDRLNEYISYKSSKKNEWFVNNTNILVEESLKLVKNF